MAEKTLAFWPINIFAEDSDKGILINVNNKWTVFPKNPNYLVTTWDEKKDAIEYLKNVEEKTRLE
jgi:hypothetical protein